MPPSRGQEGGEPLSSRRSSPPESHLATEHSGPASSQPARSRLSSTLLHPHVAFITLLLAILALTCPVIAAPARDGVSRTAGRTDSDFYTLHTDRNMDSSKHDGTDEAFDGATEAAIRAAFAAVVDPVGSWVHEERGSARWGTNFNILFGFGGEGTMDVVYKLASGVAANVSLPHRPAAFPAFLSPEEDLPRSGVLVPFVTLPPPNTTRLADDSLGRNPDDFSEETLAEPAERACLPRAWPPIRPSHPPEPYIIALVERGGCDFATKVRAAQERGAAAVVVGDKRLREGETDEEGRKRDALLTMYSPEDTTGIIIPSVFVSRASYILLRDLLSNHTIGGRSGVRVEIGPSADDGSALGSLLLFALLMPTMFLLITVTAHRVRVARQREANRAPPTVVLSLPERVWTPDIVWEKDSDESDKGEDMPENNNTENNRGKTDVLDGAEPDGRKKSDSSDVSTAVVDGGAGDSALADDEAETTGESIPSPPVKKSTRKRGKERRKSRTKRYYSKDECAICMDNFHRGEIVRILPCGHVFHKDECDEWLLKWRKLCPTCRADVTISPGDLSGSTTLTPVVGPDDVPVVDTVDHQNQGWRQRLSSGVAQVEAAFGDVADSIRAAVRRPANNAAQVARPDPSERTPLLAGP